MEFETHTLSETNMETQKGPYKDYSPSKRGAIWVSMLVWGSVHGLRISGLRILSGWGFEGLGLGFEQGVLSAV